MTQQNKDKEILEEFDEKFELEFNGCSECSGCELIDKTETPYPEGKYHCEWDLSKVKDFISKALQQARKEERARVFQEATKALKIAFNLPVDNSDTTTK